MTTNITPFAFGDNMVRVHMDENGEPWFVAKDVCGVLEIQNPSDTVRKGLDEDERADIDVIYTSSNGVEQKRSVLTVSESGLYALIFRSRKPEAKTFRKWVTPAQDRAFRHARRVAGAVFAARSFSRNRPLSARILRPAHCSHRACAELGRKHGRERRPDRQGAF